LALEQHPNNSVVYRIANVQERIEEAEYQFSKVKRQLLDLEKQELTTQEIKVHANHEKDFMENIRLIC
jgi:hypothetical protein